MYGKYTKLQLITTFSSSPQTADRVSVENGAVITNCKRWPLIIDPQGQGIRWLRQKEATHGLQVRTYIRMEGRDTYANDQRIHQYNKTLTYRWCSYRRRTG